MTLFIGLSIAIPWFLTILFFRWWYQGEKEIAALWKRIYDGESILERNLREGHVMAEKLAASETKLRESDRQLQNMTDEAVRLNKALTEAQECVREGLAKIAEFSNLNRCYSADGVNCGWHNIALQSGTCTISNKQVWQGERKKYKPMGRSTGSQFVRQLEAQAAQEE